MKILGFIMQNKILTAVIAIILVVALYFSFSGVSIDDIIGGDGDVPTGAVTIGITDVATGSVGTHTIDIEELSPTASLFGTPPVLTTYTQDVWGIEPTSEYTIGFDAMATAIKPADAPDGVSLSGNIYMAGLAGTPTPNNLEVYAGYGNINISSPSTITPWNTTTQYSLSPAFNQLTDGSNVQLIKGENIDGSVFHLTYIIRDDATNGLMYYGVINADILLNVDNDGNVEVIIDNVEADIGG